MGPRPMLAITGTDGKTTTTVLDGRDADAPPACARSPPATPTSRSSTPSTWTSTRSSSSAPASGWRGPSSSAPTPRSWLNLAPDHLNWHASMTTYEAAKARICSISNARRDVAIGFVDDPVVMRHLDAAPARHVTFGRSTADYHVARRRAASDPAARSRRSRRCGAGSRTTSPTRSRRRRSCSRSGLADLEAAGRRDRDVRRPTPPARAGRRARRRAVVQRLEGDDTTRRVRWRSAAFDSSC